MARLLAGEQQAALGARDLDVFCKIISLQTTASSLRPRTRKSNAFLGKSTQNDTIHSDPLRNSDIIETDHLSRLSFLQGSKQASAILHQAVGRWSPKEGMAAVRQSHEAEPPGMELIVNARHSPTQQSSALGQGSEAEMVNCEQTPCRG